MSLRYADPDHTAVLADDGRCVPVAPGNRDYDALLASGEIIAPYQPPPPTATDVRAEASRRMQALVGARDAAHLDIIITNGLREGIRLQEKRLEHLADPAKPQLSEAEALRAATLKQIDQAIEAIRAASNTMEAAPPANYADDARWPSLGANV